MKLHKHFLAKDLKQASFEYWKGLMQSVMDHLNAGESETAKHLSTDLTMSLHKLSKLSSKKYNLDQEKELMKQMRNSGINIQIVRSYFDDRKNSGI